MTDSLSQTVKEKLEKYSANVAKWSEAYNLLSSSQSAEQLWNRHIFDSIQIHQYIPVNAVNIIDLGSGAGFPAISCAIISAENGLPHQYFPVESVGKKSLFLEDTARILGLKNISPRNERVENITDIKADVITARAFAKLVEIFKISKDIRKEETIFILHKGKNAEEEIIEAKQLFAFDSELVCSSSGDGFILIAKNLKQL